MRVLNDSGWQEEKVTESNIVYSRVIENIGKVFKVEVSFFLFVFKIQNLF